MYVCMYACMYQELQTTNSSCVCAHLANKADSDSDSDYILTLISSLVISNLHRFVQCLQYAQTMDKNNKQTPECRNTLKKNIRHRKITVGYFV